MFISLGIGLLWIFIYRSEAACTWPVDFQDSTWHDGEKGVTTFQSSTVAGFAFTVQVQAGAAPVTIAEWECVVYDPAGPYLVMKTTTTFIQFVVNTYVAYRCLKLTKITEASYRYYQIDPPQSNINNERMSIDENTELTDVSVLCIDSLGASGSEYRVLVKDGSESSAKITCPYVVLANYSYVYAATDGSVSCDPATDVGQLDMCYDVTQMSASLPTCTALTLYSSVASVWCLDVVTVGGAIFTTLYNGVQDTATIDNSDTYTFSCIGIDLAGTQASVTPQYCKQSQSSSQVPADNSGNDVGAVLTLTRTGDYCPPCPTLTAPALGSVSLNTDGAVTTAIYTCDVGYTLSGDATRACQANGTWTGSSPSCTCSLPAALSNGTLTTSADGLTLTYSCDVGTVLNGQSTRTCQTNTNTWTGTAPTCDACDTLTQPTNGSYVITTDGLTSTLTYSCDVGTSLSGDVTRTCLLDGTWDGGGTTTCVSCPSVQSPASGSVSVTSDGALSIAAYTCSAGYHLQGANMAACIAGTGIWNSSAPTCVCDAPASPANGTVDVSADGVSATYTCDVMFTLSGQRVLTCQTDGSGWDATVPTCVECVSLTTPANGSLDLSSNGTVTMATYSCDVGFSINGDVTSQCSTLGAWSTTPPACVQCDALTTPSSAVISFVSDGSTTSAQYTCDVGATLSGDVTITCDNTGTWPASASNILCVTCPSLTTSGGKFVVTSNGTTSAATLTCNAGYTLTGSATVTCNVDGTWNSGQSTCESTDSGDDDSGGSLLAAVIALAILTTLLAAALVGALVCIYRQRKALKHNTNSSSASTSDYHKITSPDPDPLYALGKMLDDAARSSAAPVGHQHHVFSTGSHVFHNGSSAMGRAPSSHASASAPLRNSETPGSVTPFSVLSGPMSMPGSITPRSATSATPRSAVSATPRSAVSATSTTSASKLRLELVQEATSSSLHLDTQGPAPWTLHSKSPRKSPRQKTTTSPIGHTSPRRKPRNKTKDPGQGTADDLMLDLSGIVNTPRNRAKRKSKSPRKDRARVLVTNDKSTRERTFAKDKQERATTPVNHVLSVKTLETPRTPRSNHIATVQ